MALQLELQTLDREVQRPLEQIAKRFPLSSADVDNSFLRLLSAATRRTMNSGTGTLTWPGASASSNTLAVAHGLGVTPAIVLVTANSTAGTGVLACQTNGSNSTNIFVLAESASGFAPAGTATTPFSWFVIS